MKYILLLVLSLVSIGSVAEARCHCRHKKVIVYKQAPSVVYMAPVAPPPVVYVAPMVPPQQVIVVPQPRPRVSFNFGLGFLFR